MQLNDIRVPQAISPRERYARSPKLGKCKSRLVLQSKIREYCLQDAGNTIGHSKIQNKFPGDMMIPPDLTNAHEK